jgi:GTP cyclohydrolase I
MSESKNETSYLWLGDDKENNNAIPYDHKEGTLYATLDRKYDSEFVATPEYIATLGDLQNGPASNILGSHTKIHQVGIHNFRLPLKYKLRDGGLTYDLETSVTGTVSLEGQKKGINMSRIIRSFYEYKDEVFSIELLEKVLHAYRDKLGSYDAHLILNFNYPIIQKSLRSGLEGFQYYNVSLECHYKEDGAIKKYLHFDYVYSSACPCSHMLALQAMEERNKAAVSHSQRSKARVTVEFEDFLWIEDIHEMCAKAIPTEVQVMVKREDEQAFAELNARTFFVEDAARLLHEQLETNPKIKDYKAICLHAESLHAHDAISVIVKGVVGGLRPDVTVAEYRSLVC